MWHFRSDSDVRSGDYTTEGRLARSVRPRPGGSDLDLRILECSSGLGETQTRRVINSRVSRLQAIASGTQRESVGTADVVDWFKQLPCVRENTELPSVTRVEDLPNEADSEVGEQRDGLPTNLLSQKRNRARHIGSVRIYLPGKMARHASSGSTRSEHPTTPSETARAEAIALAEEVAAQLPAGAGAKGDISMGEAIDDYLSTAKGATKRTAQVKPTGPAATMSRFASGWAWDIPIPVIAMLRCDAGAAGQNAGVRRYAANG